MLFLKKDIYIKDIKYLHYTGTTGTAINAGYDYTIELINKKYIATIRLNGKSNDEIKKVEIKKDVINNIENILNKYNVYKWNNFHKYDKNVLDGNSFSFNVNYQDNKSISASGYMKWPDNYGDVRNELESIFVSLYNKT